MSSEDEYEEETSYVVFDMGNTITSDFISKAARTKGGCQLIGLEEGTPYLQLGDLIFEGEIDETIGSHMFFEVQEKKQEDNTGLLPLLTSMRSEGDESKPKITLNYVDSTETIIKFESVTINPKQTSDN
ncbi:uncharacterized protein B0P05DRAFT_562262 [Gilbertella persicaria]|uniref:Transcription factor TFIIIC triple barrel domain-containing protein n=1 Tax=Rhizopus stolonifer TaxID=4846 RepID=A0A367JZJ8_RHIST|nr:uncharacterized protein B0P05DRAFT_562262 [Gilbertella persicaria]KAI8051890.1 hypothetical protein B0P05DRAFT_562262 [Gilbertella persicaria]RCH95366.1 hypothetical protein CU098_010161 [Rhizopus stolonifer]